MAPPSADSPLLPSAKTLRRGVQIFIFFSLTGTLLGMWWKRPGGLQELIDNIQWQIVPVLIPLIALDYVLGGLRYRLFFNGRQLPFISLWDCMRSNWANISMGALTPFHSGAGPAQLYILWRKGAGISDGILVTLVNFVATLIFFLLSSIAAIAWIPEDIFGQNFAPVFRTGFAFVGIAVTTVLVVLLFPRIGAVLTHNFLNILPLGKERRTRTIQKLEAEIQRFHFGFRSILKDNKSGLILTVLTTIWLYFNKYLIGYTIATAIGLTVPFDIFIGLQIIQLLLLYFAPTPGASGLAELSTVWLMAKIMPESMLLVYAVLWRLCTMMLATVIGGTVIVLDMNESSREVSQKQAPPL